ncbi:MAG: site-specific integrase, partial [Chloroflexota bacterium]
MTKRSAQAGTIRERHVGLWEARYVGADGRRHSIYGPTSREVQANLRTALTAADHAISPPDARLTVGGWLDAWLTAAAPHLRPATSESYRNVSRLYLRPAIGGVPLSKLTPDHVGRLLAELTARGDLSPTTVRYSYAVLRIALGRALKAGKVLRNVATLIDPPAKARPELRPLSADEVRTFLASVEGDRLAPLYVVAIGTGLRQGELLGLRWADLDLDRGMLTVRHQLGRDGLLAEPKTARARRTLALGGAVRSALREQRRRQAADRLAAGGHWQDQGYVFTTPTGGPLDHANVLHRFQAAIGRAGLPHQRFHDLRHAAATLLLERGEDLAVISKMLGHSNLGTTADVYAHLTLGHRR